MAANSKFEETQHWRRIDVGGTATAFPKEFFTRLQVNPILRRRTLFVICTNYQQPLVSDQWFIRARVVFFLGQQEIGSWKYHTGTSHQPDPFTGASDIPHVAEGPAGLWPAMRITRAPASTDVVKEVVIPPVEIYLECDEIGLFVEYYAVAAGFTASFLFGLRCLSRL